MNLVQFALGLYGLSGSILIILFYIWPKWKEKRYTKKGKDIQFFGEEDPKKDQQFYKFYGSLWSFRLIGTGFLIRLLFSFEYFEEPRQISNYIFIICEVIILSFAALSIYRIRKGYISLEYPFIAFFYFNLNPNKFLQIPPILLGIYFFLFLFSNALGISPLLIAATFLSSFLFSVLWHIGTKYMI